MFSRKAISLALTLIILATPLALAYAAGGTISGTVTDPKGAVVVGAAISVTDPVSAQTFTGTTDAQGRYTIEGLPAGTYVLTVSAKGFSDFRNEKVSVEEDKAASLNVKLQVASLSEAVTVTASGTKANSDSTYQALRKKAASPGVFTTYATVNNLELKRDAATFILRSGEIYFLSPVEGRNTGAVFIGEGVLNLTPPTQIEKDSLKMFTDKETLSEEFTTLVIRFSDKTLDEVKASSSATFKTGGAQESRAQDLFKENQSLLRKQFRYNMDLRTLMDIYSPQRPGYFSAFIGGKKYNKLIFQLDPLGIPEVAPEKIILYSYGVTDGGLWTAFYLDEEYKKGTANSNQDNRLIDIKSHVIDGAINGTQITATDTLTFSPLVPGTRVVPFDLFQSLRVSSVQDDKGNELNFIQEAKDEDADFAVILPEALDVNQTYKLTVQYQGGDAMRDTGGGNFILLPRDTWYPNAANSGAFGDRAVFDITFRVPKGNNFIGVGKLAEPERVENNVTVSHWTSGNIELAVAGFNYGKFKKKEAVDKENGDFLVEFYANREVPGYIRTYQQILSVNASDPASQAKEDTRRAGGTTGIESMSTTGSADAQLADAQNSVRIYNNYFGVPPYGRIAMTQQPAGNFGQAWPTLVYMPFTAFIDQTTRASLMGSQGGTSDFWQYVGPHEIAHQWWGHVLGWTSYHDQWMSEGFSEFSASLYVQHAVKDFNKFTTFWENQRKMIVDPQRATKGRKPYTIGPVTQGYRLSNAKVGGATRFLIYPKGGYILHMLRMMMYDQRNKEGDPDARFKVMMKDFVKTYFNKDVSTNDFKKIVEKHITRDMDLLDNGKIDWFFDQWIYGTEVPAYKFEYQLAPSAGGKTVLSGRITQSGVSDNFRMQVPVWADFGKGWVRLGAATIVGNTFTDLPNIPLPMPPKKVAICAWNDVLATSIENIKR
ncbi:MAG: carboxypeptidase regulatory-like domain-containing protein [Pyrinomonadaceae bacterium]|nr:carboxypeptidase regulatory-like domain-containing protein [Pyrinomonadaceae bacterium]